MAKTPIYILLFLICIVLFGMYLNYSKQQLKDNLGSDPVYQMSKDIGNIIVNNSTLLVKDCGQQNFIRQSTRFPDTSMYEANQLIHGIPPEMRKKVEDLITQRIYDELKNNANLTDL